MPILRIMKKQLHFLAVIWVLVGCQLGPSREAEALRAAAAEQLRAGTTPEGIQEFLADHTDRFGLEDDLGYYTGWVDTDDEWSSIVIVVYVDADGNYLRADVTDAAIAP